MAGLLESNTLKNITSSARHAQQKVAVATENLALANQPGAKEKQIEDYDFKKLLNQGGSGKHASTTNSRHIAQKNITTTKQFAVKTQQSGKVTLSGNSIDPQNSMMEVTGAAMHHKQMLGTLSNMIDWYKIIIGSQR